MNEIRPPVSQGKGYLFADAINRRYLSGVSVAEGYLLYSEYPAYFTDMRYFSAVKDKLPQAGFKPLVFNGISDVAAEIKAQGIKKLFIDFTRVTLSEHEEYKKAFKNTEIADCSAILAHLRAVKCESEIENIKAACKIAEQAVKDAFSFLYSGVTEKEVKKYLETRMEELGGEGAAFDTIVAFGKNSAVPHHETGARRLKAGDAVLIDTGCKVNGYLSDITRTAFFGKPSADFIKAYNAVFRANILAEENIRGGMTGKDADGIARRYFADKGYGEYFTHSLGHGVGLGIHEHPRLSPKADDVLKENAVFTVEPGVYIEGKFGIRIEDTCVMSGGKAVRLFKDDKKLIIIDTK